MGAINPVLSGLLRGLAVGNMLRRAALERDLMERQKVREERMDQLQDLEVMQRLQALGRPVDSGRVTSQEMIRGAAPPGILPETATALGIGDRMLSVNRPADPRRTAKYTTRQGQVIETELLTPEEQATRSLQQRLAEAQLTRSLRRVQIPGYEGGPVDPEVIPFLTAEANRKASDARAKESLAAAEKRAEATAKSRVEAATITANARAAAARTRAAERGTERAEKQQEKAEAERKALIQIYQRKHDEADSDEQKAHAEKLATGRALREISARLKDTDDEAERRQLHRERIKLEAKYAAAEHRAKALEKQKKLSLRDKERVRGGHTPDAEAEAEAYLKSLR